MNLGNEQRVANVLRTLAHRIDELITPALVFDLDAAQHNIQAMRTFAGAEHWRPHVKTHKHAEVARLLLDAGVRAFKCATLDELRMLLGLGETLDVLLAYPVGAHTAGVVAELAAQHRSSTVRLLLDSPGHLEALDSALHDAPIRMTAMLDVDVGMGRTGTTAERWGTPTAQHLDLVGLHGYEGHIGWNDREAAVRGYAELVALANSTTFEVQWIITSGTHAFKHALEYVGFKDRTWAHQVSPGTLVLSDLRSAPAAELLSLKQAAFVLSRVISTPGQRRVTLDAGSKALNPDCPAPGCQAVGLPDLVAESASEEHRPCRVGSSVLSLGDLVALIPEHVCTTVNMYRVVQLVRVNQDLGPTVIDAAQRTHDLGGFARS